jgi:hypothetical protein
VTTRKPLRAVCRGALDPGALPHHYPGDRDDCRYCQPASRAAGGRRWLAAHALSIAGRLGDERFFNDLVAALVAWDKRRSA